MPHLNLSLPPELYKTIIAESDALYISQQELIRMILKRHFNTYVSFKGMFDLLDKTEPNERIQER